MVTNILISEIGANKQKLDGQRLDYLSVAGRLHEYFRFCQGIIVFRARIPPRPQHKGCIEPNIVAIVGFSGQLTSRASDPKCEYGI